MSIFLMVLLTVIVYGLTGYTSALLIVPRQHEIVSKDYNPLSSHYRSRYREEMRIKFYLMWSFWPFWLSAIALQHFGRGLDKRIASQIVKIDPATKKIQAKELEDSIKALERKKERYELLEDVRINDRKRYKKLTDMWSTDQLLDPDRISDHTIISGNYRHMSDWDD